MNRLNNMLNKKNISDRLWGIAIREPNRRLPQALMLSLCMVGSVHQVALAQDFSSAGMSEDGRLEALTVQEGRRSEGSDNPTRQSLNQSPNPTASIRMGKEPQLLVSERNEFIELFAKKHQWPIPKVERILEPLEMDPAILYEFQKSWSPETPDWLQYRRRQLSDAQFAIAQKLLKKYRKALQKAEQTYRVPAATLVALLVIDQQGRDDRFDTGKLLYNLAFTGFGATKTARMDFYQSELAHWLILVHEGRIPPKRFQSSIRGGLGVAGLLPSQIRRFGVDFDGDGQINPIDQTVDAIGTLGNYLRHFQWDSQNMFIRLTQDKSNREILKKLALSGKKQFKLQELREAGLLFDTDLQDLERQVSLIALPSKGKVTQYRLGAQNYDALIRLYRPPFFIQAVADMSAELAAQ